ncbi:MAG: TetR/AcrR family transcriptional regulator [Lachnospiraceae bacterium]|nr:TetR/AcrR family transcriptional regulator [Lachnospiraceae bacterium]
MGTKTDQNKQQKKETLLNTAFRLFTTKGINKTSISEIAEASGIAKGTFYLYFTDKYDIRNKLIAHESSQVFKKAAGALAAAGLTRLEDKIVFIADHILDQLNENQALLNLINKNLSWGIFKNALITGADEDIDFREVYEQMIAEAKIPIRDPEIMLFLIIELVSSTCYSAILYEDPVDLTQLKPHLFEVIRSIIAAHEKPLS